MNERMVEFPAMRREVMHALAALSDPEFQERVWVRKEYPGLDFYDDFTENIHCLYDDCVVVPAPEERIGSVLLPGDEIDRLRQLGAVLDRLIARHGEKPDTVYLEDPEWKDVIKLSGLALTAVVLAGGYSDP